MQHQAATHLPRPVPTTVPGIEPMNATAIVAAIGTGGQLVLSRAWAYWRGATPKQSARGVQLLQVRITKRGERDCLHRLSSTQPVPSMQTAVITRA